MPTDVPILGIMIIVLLMVLTGLNYIKFKDMMYPGFMQSALWLFILIAFISNQDMFLPISILTFAIIFMSAVSFSAGCYLATYEYTMKKKHIDLSKVQVSNLVRNLLLWVSIIGLPFFIWRACELGSSGSSENYLMNIRLSLTGQEDNGGYGILSYLVTISFCSTWTQTVALWSRRKLLHLGISFIVSMAYAGFSTGRAFFMLLFTGILGVFLITRKLSILKGIIGFSCAFILIFAVIGFSLGKIGSMYVSVGDLIMLKDNSEIAEMIIHSVKYYLLSPLPAFDSLVNQPHSFEFGANTLRTLFVILNKFDDNFIVKPLIREFTNVPMPTNVYTVFSPYYLDFSIIGIVIGSFGVGIWHGYLYKIALSGRMHGILLYSIFLYPLFMQFFEDQYFSLLSMWVQVIFMVYIVSWFSSTSVEFDIQKCFKSNARSQ